MSKLQVAPAAGAGAGATDSSRHVHALNIQKRYFLGEVEMTALKDVSLTLSRGEYVALCGSSGSGKTTLLNIIGGLDSPSAGDVFIAGANIKLMTDHELADFRRSRLGFIFQTFNLLPVLSAVENVEYPLSRSGHSRRTRRAMAIEALSAVGLEKHLHHRPSQMSGGQRQRVAIARAFVHRPELIIADEPTANLDKRTAVEILDLLGDLNARMNLTTIIATHDPVVMQRVRRIVNISDGLISGETDPLKVAAPVSGVVR